VHVAPSVCYGLMPRPLIDQRAAYLRSSGVERLQSALAALKAGAFVFPDVAFALVRDLVAAGATEKEIAPLIPVARAVRRMDPAVGRELLRIVAHPAPRFPNLRQRLAAEVALLERFHSRLRQAPRGAECAQPTGGMPQAEPAVAGSVDTGASRPIAHQASATAVSVVRHMSPG
jgi:hypothetical protein